MTTRKAALEALERVRDPSNIRYADHMNWLEDIATLRAFIEGTEADEDEAESLRQTMSGLDAERKLAGARLLFPDAEREELIAWLESYPLGRTEEGQAIARLLRVPADKKEPGVPHNSEGNYCTHHPDDPAHGPQCAVSPADEREECARRLEAIVEMGGVQTILRELLVQAARLLRSAPSAPRAEPKGWRLVPIKPTREMREAFVSVSMDISVTANQFKYGYEAMLEAAPKPEER